MIQKIKKSIITFFTDKPHQRPVRRQYSDLEALRHQIALIELYRNTGQQECEREAVGVLQRCVGLLDTPDRQRLPRRWPH